MRTFRFLNPNHEWKHVGRKHLHPYYLKMPHKHLYCPTRVESFIDYVDFDIYQKIREDFLNGHFCYLANNDEYAYMLLFDLMNGYPDDALERDFEKLDDQLGVLRRLSEPVENFFQAYINNSEYKGYLKMERKGLMKEFVDGNVNSFRFPYHELIRYQAIDRSVLKREHRWRMVDTSKPLEIESEDEPFFFMNPAEAMRQKTWNMYSVSNMSFNDLLASMDNKDWKEYMNERKDFLLGHFHDLTYKPAIALHLYYDVLGGQEKAEGTEYPKLENELWVLRQIGLRE